MKLLLLLSIFSLNVYAWGPKGQEITVIIAENHLTPNAKKGIQKIIGNNSRLSKFSTWADQARNSEEWSHTSGWHYINVEDSGSYITSPEDVTGAIEYSLDQLKSNISIAEKLTWLKFLIHFVGDLHQPMHVGKPQDRGGNSTMVNYGREMNLHFLWDSAIIDRQNLSVVNYVTKLNSRNMSRIPLQKIFTLDEIVKENLLHRKFVYSFKNRMIDQSYEKQSVLIIDERLWTGGLRLAQLLNQLFK